MDSTEPTSWAGRGPSAETAEAPQVTHAPEAAEAPPAGAPPAAARPQAAPARQRGLRGIASHPAARHLLLIVGYVAAGVAATWPNPSYLTGQQLPAVRDVSGYV